MNYNDLSRRKVLEIGAISAAGVCVNSLKSAVAAKSKKKPGIALQLYSVRKECKKDFDRTVKAVAEMGYEAVEFAGYYKYSKDAKGLKKLLDDCGLKVAGTHIKLKALQGDTLKQTIEFHKTIGNKYLIVAGMGHLKKAGRDGWENTAREMSEIAEELKDHGMLTGYHAHGSDFRSIGGSTPWEIFFSTGSKDLVMQLDIGNCMKGGGDPIAILKEFPGQTATVHLKEHFNKGRKGVLGEGNVNWKEVLTLCETIGGTEWYIIEQEKYPFSPLETVKKCLEGLKKIQAEM